MTPAAGAVGAADSSGAAGAPAAFVSAASGSSGVTLRRLGGSGAPIVLVHGFGSDRLSWLLNQSALQEAGTACVLDLPGHGDAGPDVGDGELETLAARVAEALERAGLQGAHLVGHSLGGAVALLVAASRPPLVASLTLISPAGLGEGVATDFLLAYPELEDSAAAQVLLRRLVTQPGLIGRPLVARVLEQLARPGARAALRAVVQGLRRADEVVGAAARRVADADVPRLVIWGADDAINPRAPQVLADFGGELLVVPGTVHLPHVEAAALVNAAIVRFVRAVAPA